MPRRCRSLEHPKLTEFAFTVMVKAVERKQCNCLACTETPTVIRPRVTVSETRVSIWARLARWLTGCHNAIRLSCGRTHSRGDEEDDDELSEWR